MPIHAAPAPESPARLLRIERDAAAGEELATTLRSCFAVPPTVEVVGDSSAAATRLKAAEYDLVLADIVSLAQTALSAEDAVARLARLSEGALLIVLADGGSVSAALAAMRAGAHECVARPQHGHKLARRISELAQRHGKSAALAGAGGTAPEAPEGSTVLVGASPQMQVVLEQIHRIAPSSAPVFITGEGGVGKGVCAETLHAASPRAGRRFVAVDCAGIPRDLMERELFGVQRGAYSGAYGERKGALELADGGTLFLGEIGELDLSLQGKLLRFLQSGALCRVGEDEERPADVRLICSTSGNPMQLMAERRFREDLFYRLHVLPVHLPPLRQRPGDVTALAQHFLQQFAREEHKAFTGFSAAALERLAAHGWPGNVRQLKKVVRRLALMCAGGEIGAEVVAAADMEVATGAGGSAANSSAAPPVLPMWQQEQRIIEEAIARCNGNIALAAAALELSPSTIYRKRQAWSEASQRRGAA
jgi:two-component system, repressor protein LuxO